MAKYFNYFPKTVYSANNDFTGLDSVTNIISRFSFEQSLKDNSSVFYKYQIKESDTPEIIARKYYENVERHWIVLLFNDIVDPQFDWPLQGSTLIDYIEEKYSANGAANTTPITGLRWAQEQKHSYYKIITYDTSEGSSFTKLEVDANTYANIQLTSNTYTLNDSTTLTETVTKESITYYQYEVNLNESKREIRLLKPEFVPQVEKEFRRVVRI